MSSIENTTTAVSISLLEKQVFSVLVIIEFLSYIILTIWVGIIAYICYTVKVFHRHLNALIFTLFFNFYLIAVSRIVFIVIKDFDEEYGNSIILLEVFISVFSLSSKHL